MEQIEEKVMKFSFVIPVYNMQKYLHDCLDSLVCQNIPATEYEAICVNDGSTDNSLSILEEYAAKYSFVKIISQSNSGHAAARQTGLENATGIYVTFLDADDFIDANCLNGLWNYLEHHHVDMCTIKLFFPSENIAFTPSDSSLLPVEAKKIQLSNGCSGSRFIRRKILTDNRITWNKALSPNDDVLFLFYVDLHATNKTHLSQPAYYWRQRSDSVSHQRTAESTQKFISSFLLMAEIYQQELQKDYDPEIKKGIRTRLSLTVQGILLRTMLTPPLHLKIDTLLNTLKDKGLYPYPFNFWNLKPKRSSLKRVMIDYVTFLFPIRCYYKLLFSITRIIIRN